MTTFTSCDGEYLVSVQDKPFSREELWYYSVGRVLRDQLAMDAHIYRAYVAAEVASSQPKSVVDRLRSLPRLAGRVQISTVFRQAPVVAHHIIYFRKRTSHVYLLYLLFIGLFSNIGRHW